MGYYKPTKIFKSSFRQQKGAQSWAGETGSAIRRLLERSERDEGGLAKGCQTVLLPTVRVRIMS